MSVEKTTNESLDEIEEQILLSKLKGNTFELVYWTNTLTCFLIIAVNEIISYSNCGVWEDNELEFSPLEIKRVISRDCSRRIAYSQRRGLAVGETPSLAILIENEGDLKVFQQVNQILKKFNFKIFYKYEGSIYPD